ncbi:hypothetical protein H4R19_003917 [Coemansia spiralis]|nr:hypothetical protein H4R19_003917 [Coemansia spiralis]
MADFGFEWGSEDAAEPSDSGSSSGSSSGGNSEAGGATGLLPPGVVVHRVAASDKPANAHGTTESELVEPMVEDKAKALQAKTLEHDEENLSQLEVFCQRAQSMFIFQRVWAAKEVGRLLAREPRRVALGVLVPIAMRLADDHELFVRETMAQELGPVLRYYYANKAHVAEANDGAEADAAPDAESDADSLEDAQPVRPEPDAAQPADCDKELPPLPPGPARKVVPAACAPSADEFGAWLHRVLLTPHPSVSLPAQRAAVSLGRQLGFEAYHTEIVHGVILGLVQSQVHQQIMRQRSKDTVIKPRGTSSPPTPREASHRPSGSSSNGMLSNGLATLFGRRSWQGGSGSSSSGGGDDGADGDDDDDDDVVFVGDGGNGFFVSPVETEARLELTRRKLLMLHMIHLVASEFGAEMRPAVFVPVVERAAKDQTFEVRRDAAAVLGSLAKAVSTDLALDVLYPCFVQLTQDAIWQVRQSAARHALPGLALVLAARSRRPPSASVQLADCERKYSLLRFAQPASTAAGDTGGDGADAGPLGGGGSTAADDGSGDPLAAYMYRHQPPRSVPDKQWLQLVERMASTREPSHHVRAAVFESVGKLVLALVDCPRTRDALVSLVVADVGRAHGDQAPGRLGLFGSSGSLQSLDEDDSDDTGDENDVDDRPRPTRDAARASRPRAVGHDVLYHSAFNFPALLAALGPVGWDRLRDVYMQLSKTEHYEVRQTLACSLHEVARILVAAHGPVAAVAQRLAAHRVSANAALGPSAPSMSSYSADLESVLCLFLIDGAEIKMGALAHLGDTLTWLTAASRVRCLPMIMQVFKHDGKQWRTRQVMAAQLVKLCHLFPASIVVGSLLPQAVEWAHDPVAGVRAAVAPAFPIMFELTKLDPSTQVRFFETVISFSHASSFRGRLFFVEICAALLAHDHDPDADPVDFDQFFLPSLAALATDRVANVRISLARLVRRMLENRSRRKSISQTLADIWAPPPAAPADDDAAPAAAPRPASLRRRSSSTARRRRASGLSTTRHHRATVGDADEPRSPTSNGISSTSAGAGARRFAHRSLGSTVGRRPRRNTTPMRAHLLATMVQQLAADTDRDVLDLIRDLPGHAAPVHHVPAVPTTTATATATVPTTAAPDDDDNNKLLLLQFPQPPASPPLAAQKPLTDDEQSVSALDELLPSYERSDESSSTGSMSAISLPLDPQ